MVAQTEEEKRTKVGFLRLLKMSTKEWPYILVGLVSTAGVGSIMPLFAVNLSALIAALVPDVTSSKVLRFSILFWCLGVAQFALSSIQVCTYHSHLYPRAVFCSRCSGLLRSGHAPQRQAQCAPGWAKILSSAIVPNRFRDWEETCVLCSKLQHTLCAGLLFWAGRFQPRIACARAVPEGSSAPRDRLVRSGPQLIGVSHIPSVIGRASRAGSRRRRPGPRHSERIDSGVQLRRCVHKRLENDPCCHCRTTFAGIFVLHADEVFHRYGTLEWAVLPVDNSAHLRVQ